MKSRLLICFLFSSLISYSNKIDELKTEADIAHFVNELSGYTSSFPKTNIPNLSPIRYLKIDIDKNGLTDLLINDRKIFAIIDVGNDKFELKYVGTEHKECRLVSIDTTGQEPILVIKKQNNYIQHEPAFSEVPDSITYKFNNFIEYNSKPQEMRVESIKISMGPCFGNCPTYDLLINNNREAEIIETSLKAKITKQSFDEIITLISYLNPDSLKANYAIDATDNPSADIEIKFNGKLKTIHDYGLEGTLGLQQLYLLIDKLVKDAKWEHIPD